MTCQIKDIKGFYKLFKINIPVYEEFDYYINLLKQSSEFTNLDEQISVFIDLEQFVQKHSRTVASQKLDHDLPKIIQFIKQTSAYANLLEANIPDVEYLTKSYIKDQYDCLFSVDIKKANYNIIKILDSKNELFDSWDILCNNLGIHRAFAISKSFRQVVFGKLCPRRISKFIHASIMNFSFNLLSRYALNIVSITSDECIWDVSSDPNMVSTILKHMKDFQLPMRGSLFKIHKIDRNCFVKTFLDMNYKPKYKALFCVPGNKFYRYFKPFILDDNDLEERDLLFIHEGELAKWVI